MRQTKFRGLTKNGEWIYGDLINYQDGTKAIIRKPLSASGYLSVEGARLTLVDVDTVGQSTGLTDKNGIEIYESDVIGKDDSKFVKCGVVSFIHGCWMVASKSGEHYFNLHWYLSQVEIVGNIHNNPELLERNQ